MNLMENLGSDFNQTGSVMSPQELAAMRKKRGECPTCGNKLFKKKVFKMTPLNIPGQVNNGRCLKCNPDRGAPVRPTSGKALTNIGGPSLAGTGPRAPAQLSSMAAVTMVASVASAPRPNSLPANRAISNHSQSRSNSGRSLGSGGTLSSSHSKAKAIEATAVLAPAPAPPPAPEASVYDDHGYDASEYDAAGYDDPTEGNFPEFGDTPSNLPPIPPSRESETSVSVLGNHAKVSSNSSSDATHNKEELQKAIGRLNDSSGKPEGIEKSMEELATMKLVKDNLSYLVEQRLPRSIAKAMNANLDNIHIQKWGCSAVFNLAGTTKCQEAFVKGGIMDSILTTMEKNMGDAGFQEQALSTIANLAAAKKNLPTLVNKGALERMTEAMSAHTGMPAVLVKACNAVANLASHESSLKKKIMKVAGGIVVIAMVMNPNHVGVIEASLRALHNLSANNDDNKTEIANNGGVDSMISAMQLHRDDIGIQLEGSWTMAHLCSTEENKEVIGDCGGLDVIVRALWVHPEERRVLEKALRALYYLSTDAHNASVVIEVGGINAIVTLMQTHPDAAAIQEIACAVLYNLGDLSDDNRMQIVDEEALDAIVLTMVLHSEDAEVQKRACLCLECLCIPDNYKPMYAANIVELVTVAGEKFPGCKEAHDDILGQMEGD